MRCDLASPTFASVCISSCCHMLLYSCFFHLSFFSSLVLWFFFCKRAFFICSIGIRVIILDTVSYVHMGGYFVYTYYVCNGRTEEQIVYEHVEGWLGWVGSFSK